MTGPASDFQAATARRHGLLSLLTFGDSFEVVQGAGGFPRGQEPIVQR
jgi:hypothetical protein